MGKLIDGLRNLDMDDEEILETLETLVGTANARVADVERQLSKRWEHTDLKMINLHKNGRSNLRKTGQQDFFPYVANTVPFIHISSDSVCVSNAKVRKLGIVLAQKPGDILLAVWPGEWRTDVFEVDDLKVAEKALMV